MNYINISGVFLLLIIIIIEIMRLFKKNKQSVDVQVKNELPEKSKLPLYFKLNNFNVFIKIIDYDHQNYKFVYNRGKIWSTDIKIELKYYMERVYKKIEFDPLK